MRTTWFSTVKDIRKASQRDMQEEQSQPIIRVRQPTNGRIVTTAGVLPSSQGSECHIRLLSLGVLHWEGEPPWCLAFKSGMAYILESQKIVWKRRSALKKCMQKNLTHSEPQSRASNLKRLRVQLTCWSWRYFSRGGRQLELSLGT